MTPVPILYVRRKESDAVSTPSVCELWRGAICLYRGYGVENTAKRMAAGIYRATRTRSPRFSKVAGHDVKTWELHGVMDGTRLRQGIRIHPANFAKDLEGCLALGMAHLDIDKDGAMDVTSSRRGIQLFEQACGDAEEITVEVIDHHAA